MKFPFTKNMKYFTVKEEQDINEFIALNVQVGSEYTNPDGEVRVVEKITLPLGSVTNLTVAAPMPNRELAYHTPLASLEGVQAAVLFLQDGKGDSATSDEWVKWIGAGGTIKDKMQMAKESPRKDDATDRMAKGRMKSFINNPDQNVDFAKEDKRVKEESKKGNRVWKKQTRRSKSA